MRRTLALLLLPLPLCAADLTFTGNLRFIATNTITVRLPTGVVIDARLPKTGDLTAEKLSSQYKLADQVQIECKKIQSVWDEPVKRYHSLELTRIHFLRAPSPQEFAQVSASLSWKVGDNLLKPAPAPPPRPTIHDPPGLDRVRDVNLARAAAMPNFVADEIETRSQLRNGQSKWKQLDIVEAEVTFHANESKQRQHIRINGKPYTSLNGWIPGVNFNIEDGEIKPLFDRNCANTFEAAGREELRGKQLTAFHFESSLDGCFGAGTMNHEQFNAARTGKILIDDSTGEVIQSEYRTYAESGELSPNHVSVTWDYVMIGDASHLLPVAADSLWAPPWGDQYRVAIEYKNHRHFEASTNITFHP